MNTDEKIIVTRSGEGKIRVKSEDESVVKAYAGNDDVLVVKKGKGETNVQVTVEESKNYEAAGPAFVKVTADEMTKKVKRPQAVEQTYLCGTDTFVTSVSFIHDGTVRMLSVVNGSSENFVREGNISAVKAGTYKVVYKLNSNCVWEDTGTSEDHIINWGISKGFDYILLSQENVILDNEAPVKRILISRCGDGMLYVTSDNPNIVKAEIRGSVIILTRIAEGNTTVTITGSEGINYKMPNSKFINVHCEPPTIEIPAYKFNQTNVLLYNGEEQSPKFEHYDPEYHILSGITKAVDAGKYTAKIKPQPKYHWEDTGKQEERICQWTILQFKLPKPVPSVELPFVYDGSYKELLVSYFEPDYEQKIGTMNELNAGIYHVLFMLKDLNNYCWEDNTNKHHYLEWEITPAPSLIKLSKYESKVTVSNPIDTISIDYNGDGDLKITTDDVDQDFIIAKLEGNDLVIKRVAKTSADREDTHITVTITAVDGFNYSEPDPVTVDVLFVQDTKYIDLPTAENITFDYDGKQKRINIINDYPNAFKKIGLTAGVDPGDYQLIFQLNEGFEWKDAPATDIEIVRPSLPTDRLMIWHPSNLPVPVLVNDIFDENVEIVHDEEKNIPDTTGSHKIELRLKNSGTVWSDNLSAENKTLHYIVSNSVPIVNELSYRIMTYSAEELQKIVQSGEADQYLKVGDLFPIILDGDIGERMGFNMYLHNFKMYAVVIGIDHNKEVESDGRYSVHFSLGADLGGKNIAFGIFEMFREESIQGWYDSLIRNRLMHNIYNALPQEWRNIIAECTKYSYSSYEEDGEIKYAVFPTKDKIFLFSAHEITGKYDIENGYCRQYEYFTKPENVYKYDCFDIDSMIPYWTRSCYEKEGEFIVIAYGEDEPFTSPCTEELHAAVGFVVA